MSLKYIQPFTQLYTFLAIYFFMTLTLLHFAFQNVLFYVISDDMKSAKEYIQTEQNEKLNIALPYEGAIKEGSMTWPRKKFCFVSNQFPGLFELYYIFYIILSNILKNIFYLFQKPI